MRVALLCGAAFLGACGGARQPLTAGSVPPNLGTTITQERIVASGAKTAWDALRLTVPYLQFRETRGNASRIHRRGRTSIHLDDQVRAAPANARISHLQMVPQIAAPAI